MSASRTLKFAFVFALAALLVSCTFTRFAYNQADTVIAWMADDYFDFNQQQKQEFQKRFDRVYTWHRHEQLPDYAQFMRTARTRMEDGLSREDVFWFVDGLKTRSRAAARYGAPEAAVVLATVTPAQIENLQRKWEKENKKYAKERMLNGTPDERQDAEAKRMIKAIKDWLGPLTTEQEQRAIALAREFPQIQHLRYAERLRRQKEFLEVLAHRSGDRESFTARLVDWTTNWEKGRAADYQKLVDVSWEKRADLYVTVDKMMSPDQRTAYLQRIQGYSDDFTQLARREGSRSSTAAR